MKKILMITTGGTIASIPSENGLVPALSGIDIINLVPALKEICNIDVIEMMNIDSSNISTEKWLTIMQTIEMNYKYYDGFVITHGTDTMAYSSSMFACAVTNFDKPIVFTGSQLPINVDGTDACKNIHDAFLTACSGVGGIFLAFNGTIHYGDCVKKIYSEDFIGFLSINKEPAGISDNKKIIWNKPVENISLKNTNKALFTDLSVKVLDEKPISLPKHKETGLEFFNKNLSNRVFVIKVIPSIKPDIIDVLINMGYRGIIIESYGAGGVPTEKDIYNFIPAIKKAVKNGIPILFATQCLYNGVHLDKYPMGIMAGRYGAISCKNMTLEKAIAKLMLGLGNNLNMKELKEYIEHD